MASLQIGLFALVVLMFVGRSDENNLSPTGVHVCSSTSYYTGYENYRTWRRAYTTYYTRCGWFGRCKRSRSYRSYYYTTRTVQRGQTNYFCCSGWARRGSSRYCPVPVCSGGCNHGHCSSPGQCSCNSGWHGSRCQNDNNECSSSNGGCQQRCINTAGSYRCGCNRGYRKTSFKACQDFNECNNSPCKCASNINTCGATCTNTPGSFTCSCGVGFRLESGTVCKDVDECSTQQHNCAQTCVNTMGSYSCICRPGYLSSQNGKKCTDIDECQTGNGECEHDCRNTVGSRICSCRKGYRLEANQRTCVDIDECSEKSPCHHNCQNLVGSFTCSCRTGYKLNYDKTTCTDINECKSYSSHCEQTCTNTEGSYTCGCRPGYKLHNDQTSCKDVDECAMGTHQCSQLCINTIGSYKCRCRQGYELDKDGKNCKGIPCQTLYPPLYGSMTCTGMVTNDNCSFTCNHGYNMKGPSTSTCMTTSRWSELQTTCKAKECGRLTPSSHVILSLPCYRTYGSSCDMRCSSGFYSTGNSKVTCDLTDDKNSVAWKNDFQCHRTEVCKPNPCQHGGKCVIISSKTFKCDCANTGYVGNLCQEGVIEFPKLPKLKANLESPPLMIRAKPSKEIQITIQADDHVVPHPRTIKIQHDKTQSNFTLTSKQPGLESLSFAIQGESGKDFKPLPDRVLFASPTTSNKKNIFANVPILPGELPTGCHVIKTDTFMCNVDVSSTLPWQRSQVHNKQSSTQGIVHLVTGNGLTIPLSLIGAEFPFSTNYIFKNIQHMNQLSKNITLKTTMGNTCTNATLEVPQLMELVEHDNFVISFLTVMSKSIPSWLQFNKKIKSDNFDLGNIHAKVALTPKSCSSLLKSSNVVTYQPNIGLTISLGDVTLPDDNGFCYAIDVCTSDVSFRLPQSSVEALMSTPLFQDMKNSGWEIEPKEIMFSGSTEKFGSTASMESHLWDGKNMVHQRTQKYKFAIAGKMKTKLDNQRGVRISLNCDGNVYVNTHVNVSEVFYEGFQHGITGIIKGKASINMTTTVLNKSTKLIFPLDEIVGQFTLGGDSTNQGIFLRRESSFNPFQGTPFASMVRVSKNKPFFLVIKNQIRGGRQNGTTNIIEFNIKITLVNVLLLQLRTILNNPQVALVIKQNSLKRWKSHISEAETIIKDLRALIGVPFQSETNVNSFSLLISKLKIHVRNMKRLCKIIELVMVGKMPSPQANITAQVKQLLRNFPSLPDVQIQRTQVLQNFRGFKMRFQGTICERRMCFNDMQVTLDSGHTSKLSSKLQGHDQSVIIQGETLKDLKLGKILTIPRQKEVKLFVPATEKLSTLVFEPTMNIMGLKKTVRVKMSNSSLRSQTSGLLFGKYDALIDVSAKYDVPDWSLLKYHVSGKMEGKRSLRSLFEKKLNTHVQELAAWAATRIQNSKTVAREAANNLLRFIPKVKRLSETHKKYERKKQNLKRRQELAKRDYILLKNKVRDDVFQSTRTCQPKQCQKICSSTSTCTFENKKLVINETKYDCKEVQTYIQRIKNVKRSAIDHIFRKTFYEVYTGNCGSRGIITTVLRGCDHTFKTVRGPDKRITFLKVWYEEVPVKIPVTKYKCTSYVVKKTTNSFLTPRLTCTQSSCSIKVMDPECIKNNSQCIKLYRQLQANRSMSEYEKYKVKTLLKLNRLENAVEIANTKLEQIDAKRMKALEELKMAKAQLKLLEYAKNKSEEAVHEVQGFERTKLGMNLLRVVQKTPSNQNVVSVSDVTFNDTMTEASKTEIPLQFAVTFDKQTRQLSFLFDFGNDKISLRKMIKNTLKNLFQEDKAKRKRRSISGDLLEKVHKTNDTENLKHLNNHDRCMLAKKANLFYRDIVQSLKNLLANRENVKKSNMADAKKLNALNLKFKNLAKDLTQDKEKVNDTDNTQEMVNSYSNMIRSLMDDKQNYSLMSWNQSLISWKAFLEALTNERSFSDCASVQDCLIAVGDDLKELYFYESDFQPANEIREMLSNVTNNILALITTNFTEEEITSKISLLDELLNQTIDVNVLCGKKPEIIFNSEESRVVLENDTFVLECVAKSDTPLRYEWIHKNISIHQSTNGRLTIRNANFSHAGGYQCKASNRKGSVTSNVTIITINSKPRIIEHPASDARVYTKDGVGLLLRCNVTGVPFPRIDWFFVSQHPNSSIVPLNNNNGTFLYYQNMVPDDSGYYYCTATNKHGQVKSKKARVWVLDTSPGEPRLGVKVNMTKRCKKQRGCMVRRPPKDDSKQLNHYRQLFSSSMNSSQSQITDMQYVFDDQGNAAISFIYKSSKPEKQDVDDPLFDPILESFSRKRTKLADDLKTLYQQMKNGSFGVSSDDDDDDDDELVGDPDSLTAWMEPPGCPRGQQPHSNGYLCAACPPGTYGKEDGRCEPCPVKTYQYQSGQTKCISCKDGYSTKQGGSLSPDDCHDMRPSPPRDLRATAIGSTRLQVKWRKPKENSHSINFYIIKYGKFSRRRHRTNAVPKTATTWPLTSLRKFTDYRIVVQAINSYNGTKKSMIVTKTGEGIPDAAPFITRATPISYSSIRVTWRPIPKYQRNGIIQGYHIYYSQYSRDEWKVYTTPTGNITTCVVPGLKPLTLYCVKMSAFTSKGEYPGWNKTSCKYVKITVTGQAVSTTAVILKFLKITSKHLVKYGENPAYLTHTKECRSSSCVIDGLKENTLYHFKITTQIVQIGGSAVNIQVRTLKKTGS